MDRVSCPGRWKRSSNGEVVSVRERWPCCWARPRDLLFRTRRVSESAEGDAMRRCRPIHPSPINVSYYVSDRGWRRANPGRHRRRPMATERGKWQGYRPGRAGEGSAGLSAGMAVRVRSWRESRSSSMVSPTGCPYRWRAYYHGSRGMMRLGGGHLPYLR